MKIVAVGDYIFFKELTLKNLQKSFQFEHIKKDPTYDVLDDTTKDADVLITYGEITPKFVKSRPNIRLIVAMSTGKETFETVDMKDSVKQTGAVLAYTPDYSTQAVAEYTFTAILSLLTKMFSSVNLSRLEESSHFLTTQRRLLSNYTIGIIGLGKIGTQLANMLLPINKNILVYTSNPQSKKVVSSIRFCNDLSTLAMYSDAIAVTCSLNSQTYAFLNKKSFFKYLKKDVALVNTARGMIFEPISLIEFLYKNPKASFFTDVLDFQDDKIRKRLKDFKNTYITPHVAFNALESLYKCTDIALNSIEEYRQGKRVTNSVF